MPLSCWSEVRDQIADLQSGQSPGARWPQLSHDEIAGSHAIRSFTIVTGGSWAVSLARWEEETAAECISATRLRSWSAAGRVRASRSRSQERPKRDSGPRLGQVRSQRLSGNAEIAAIYALRSSQFAHHGCDGFCGNGESETDGTASGQENCRSDADDCTIRGKCRGLHDYRD